MRKIKIIVLTVLTLFAISCEDLEVENINDPTYEEYLNSLSSEKVLETYGALYNEWFDATHSFSGPALFLWNMADAGTSPWGGLSGNFAGYEPRRVFDNSSYYVYVDKTEVFYKMMYNILSLSNDLLYINDCKDIMYNGQYQSEMISAYAYFMQGISLGYLGLIFDQAFIVTENTNLKDDIPVSPYSEVIDAALNSLDKAIAICETETFTIPDSWVPGISLDQTTFGQLVNSYAARILAYSPRNATENENIDWTMVYTYASNGIDFDFSPLGDGELDKWHSDYHTYANYAGFGLSDMRLAHMMDPDMPSRWPGEDGFSLLPNPKETIEEAYDDRIITDFEYNNYCNFYSERGLYFFSCYRFSRRDEYLSTWTEPMPEMYKAENDLLLAEAALKTKKLTEAATIINNGTRVSRGGLPTISANETEIEEAIFHERNIELHSSGIGVEYFTMRKADKLQSGTILHFPIPGPQLEILNWDYYTFGPEVGIPGTDYSIGGWK